MFRKLAIMLVALALPALAHAQALQNYIVPTAPVGTSNNQAASTAFVQVNSGSLLTSLAPFSFPCNPTGITAIAIACPALTAVAPLGVAGSILSVNNAAPNGLFIGGAGNGTTTTTTSVGVGGSALIAITSGNGNVALGNGALVAITTGPNNIGIGVNAGAGLTGAASSNIAIGSGTLGSANTGTTNTAIGASALNKTTNSGNTAVGNTALFDVTSGFANTGVGNASGRGNVTGSNNTTLGACQGLAAASAGVVALCDGAGNYRYDWAKTTAAATTIAGPLRVVRGTPAIASGACGTGTNGTITGDDQSGAITIGAAATATCTVTFSTAMTTAPNSCVLFPGNAAAAATGTTVAFASAPTTAGFVLNGTTLANTVYRFMCL